jgi:hypothetical protein
VRVDASVSDAAAAPIPVCPPSPEAISARCRGADTDLCRLLSSDRVEVRQRAYVGLVLAAEPALAGLRFRHGPRAGRSFAELWALAQRDATSAASLAEALELAFSGCRDHRILGRSVTTPVCESAGGGFVDGVEEAPCLALDHACGRGYYDGTRGCCDTSRSIPGASCEAALGTGACGESGRCELGRSVVTTNVHAWAEVVPARSGPARLADWTEGETSMVRVGEVWDDRALSMDELTSLHDSMYGWARVTVSGRRHPIALTRVRRERDGADGVLAAHSEAGLVALYLHEGQLGRSVEDVTTVLAVNRPIDEYTYLGADGSAVPAAGVLEVACGAMARGPDGADEEPPADSFSCRVSDEGFVRVAGPALTGLLLVGGRADVDVRPAGRLGRSGELPERRPVRPSVALGTCSPVGSSRSCGCGTRQQTCVSGGIWGPCVGTERCNGCDDDADGRTDEGGTTLCNDGLGCTADGCGMLFPNAPVECINLPTPALCRRGACTVGVCASASSGTTPSQATQRARPATPPFGPTGCQWRESDTWCETQWDRCNCNGMARCDGSLVAPWSGATPPATLPGSLGTSLASCVDRPAVGPQSEPGDVPAPPLLVLCSHNSQCAVNQVCNGGSCQNVRNGGCETNRNACSVDRVCIEPHPSTSTCRLFDPTVKADGPALRAAQVQLQSLGVTSSTIDGLAVSCSTQTPPFPYNLLCQTDGRPCTVPHDPSSISCNPTTGVCGAQTAVTTAVVQAADIVGAQWNGTGFVTLLGNDCTTAIEGNPNSCYQEVCQANTGLCNAQASDAVCNQPVARAALGRPDCGGPFRCSGLVAGPGAVDPSTVGSSGQIIGGFQGCSRQSWCLDGATCYPAGEVQPQCSSCIPEVSSNRLLPRANGFCDFMPDGFIERCGRCVSPGTCIARNPVPPGCSLD